MREVVKAWGVERILVENELYTLKEMVVQPGWSCSLHRHRVKDETFVAASELGARESSAPVHLQIAGSTPARLPLRLRPWTWHRFWVPEGAEPGRLVEVSTADDPQDVERLLPSHRMEDRPRVVFLNGRFTELLTHTELNLEQRQFLQFARSQGDWLVVGVPARVSGRQASARGLSLEQRMAVLRNLACVDAVVAIGDSAEEVCQLLSPDILVADVTARGQDLPEAHYCRKVVYCQDTPTLVG